MGELTLAEWEIKNEIASQKIQHLLRVLSKSKMLHVLYTLGMKDGSARFSEIKESSSVDSTTLSRRLNELEGIEMITRNEISANPPAVEYRLTDSFDNVKPILEALLHYGLESESN
jgi:DNA-binding HxlR family transcriptional regulator